MFSIFLHLPFRELVSSVIFFSLLTFSFNLLYKMNGKTRPYPALQVGGE